MVRERDRLPLPDSVRQHIARVHKKAMDAKEVVFRAQDALSDAWQAAVNSPHDLNPRGKSTALLRKLEDRLRRVRNELEQLDNDIGDARCRRGALEEFDRDPPDRGEGPGATVDTPDFGDGEP